MFGTDLNRMLGEKLLQQILDLLNWKVIELPHSCYQNACLIDSGGPLRVYECVVCKKTWSVRNRFPVMKDFRDIRTYRNLGLREVK